MVRETASSGRDPRTEMELAGLRRIAAIDSEVMGDYYEAVQHYLSNATEVDQMERTNRIRVEYLSGVPKELVAVARSIMLELDPGVNL